LIDWKPASSTRCGPLFGSDLVRRSRNDIFLAAFARHETAQEAETPEIDLFQLLALVHALAEEWGNRRECRGSSRVRRLGRQLAGFFPDSAAALAYLKHFYKLVICRMSTAPASRRAEALGVALIWSIPPRTSVRTNPIQNFRTMTDGLGRSGQPRVRDLLHTAQSLFHDHAPANAVGLRSAWIDRRSGGGGLGGQAPAA